MHMKRKFSATICALLACFVLSVPVYAEEPTATEPVVDEPVVEEPVQETPSESDVWVRSVSEVMEKYTGTVKIEYTLDSTASDCVLYEPYVDVLTKTVGIRIIADVPYGHRIYDDPNTEYIDGIRVNGNTVASLTVPIDLSVFSANTNIEIVVKTTYTEDILGTIAQIHDGTYDYTQLLSNPVILLQALYYALAALSVIIGGVGLARSKKKKVKTADEISEKVSLATAKVEQDCVELFNNILNTQLIPIINETLGTNQSIVKAITLSTSKSKGAQSDLLDTLQQVSNATTSDLITKAKESIQQANDAAEHHKEEVLQTLNALENSNQGEHNNVKSEEGKSIF